MAKPRSEALAGAILRTFLIQNLTFPLSFRSLYFPSLPPLFFTSFLLSWLQPTLPPTLKAAVLTPHRTALTPRASPPANDSYTWLRSWNWKHVCTSMLETVMTGRCWVRGEKLVKEYARLGNWVKLGSGRCEVYRWILDGATSRGFSCSHDDYY